MKRTELQPIKSTATQDTQLLPIQEQGLQRRSTEPLKRTELLPIKEQHSVVLVWNSVEPSKSTELLLIKEQGHRVATRTLKLEENRAATILIYVTQPCFDRSHLHLPNNLEPPIPGTEL